jgi:chaperone required for assembly of F1-ATPase
MADLRSDLAPDEREPIDPVKMARRDLQKTLPKRFYTEVTTAPHAHGHALLLDGKPVRTPAKDYLVLPSAALAEHVAAEWRAQTELIDPATMPLTKLANTAIDGVARTLDATAAEVAKFAETDLVCYRAGSPAPLIEAQSAMWDPVLAFAHETLGVRFLCAEGVMYVAQPEPARRAVRDAVDELAAGPSGALKLAALSVMTSLTGSVLLALAVARGHLTAEEAWTAAHVDEDFQARFWGSDADAIARRERRWQDMAAAALAYRLS